MQREILSQHRWVVAGGAMMVGAAILSAAGCARDGSRDFPTRPAFSLLQDEGGVTADVQREWTEKVNGNSAWYDFGDTTVYAPFAGDLAFPDSQAAIPSPLGTKWSGWEVGHSGADTVVDSLNNVHVVAYVSSAGTPPSHVQHFVNGQLQMDQTYLWVGTDDGWVMSESYLNLYIGGDTLSMWSAADGEIAMADQPVLDVLSTVAYAPILLLRPKSLSASGSCVGEWAVWIGSVMLVEAAAGFYVETQNWITRRALVGAIVLAEKAFWDLMDCMLEE